MIWCLVTRRIFVLSRGGGTKEAGVDSGRCGHETACQQETLGGKRELHGDAVRVFNDVKKRLSIQTLKGTIRGMDYMVARGTMAMMFHEPKPAKISFDVA